MRNIKTLSKVMAVGVLILVSILVMKGGVLAQIPQYLNFQGRLTDLAGDPITGDHQMDFSIYTTSEAGSTLWTETHSAVTVTNGIYNVLLGSVTDLDLDFSDGYWLGIDIDSTGEMTPRHRLSSVAYALNAERVDGKSAGEFVSISGDTMTGDLTVEGTLTADYLIGDGAGLTNIGGGTHHHDADYVNIDGDTMTGTLTLGAGAAIEVNDQTIYWDAGKSVSTVTEDWGSPAVITYVDPASAYYVTTPGTWESGLQVSAGTAAIWDVTSPGGTFDGARIGCRNKEVVIETKRDDNAGSSTNINIYTGDAHTSGDSGDVNVFTGASAGAGGVEGVIKLQGGYGDTGVTIDRAGNIQTDGDLYITGVITGDASGLTNVPTGAHEHADYVDVAGDTMTGTLTAEGIHLGTDKKLYFGNNKNAYFQHKTAGSWAEFVGDNVQVTDVADNTGFAIDSRGIQFYSGNSVDNWAYWILDTSAEAWFSDKRIQSDGNNIAHPKWGGGYIKLSETDTTFDSWFGSTKAILDNINTLATGKVSLAGDAMTGTLTMDAGAHVKDDQKIYLGDSNDSYIWFRGTIGKPEFNITSLANLTFDTDSLAFYLNESEGLIDLWAGNNQVAIGTAETIFNGYQDDIDFQVQGNTDANLIYVDADNDRVGIGTNAPDTKLHVVGNVTVEGTLYGDGSGLTNIGGGSHDHDADYVNIDGDAMTGTLEMGAGANVELADDAQLVLGAGGVLKFDSARSAVYGEFPPGLELKHGSASDYKLRIGNGDWGYIAAELSAPSNYFRADSNSLDVQAGSGIVDVDASGPITLNTTGGNIDLIAGGPLNLDSTSTDMINLNAKTYLNSHMILGSGASIEANDNKIYWDAGKTHYKYWAGSILREVAPQWEVIDSDSSLMGIFLDNTAGWGIWAGPTDKNFAQIDLLNSTGSMNLYTRLNEAGDAGDIMLETDSGYTSGDGGDITLVTGAGVGGGVDGLIKLQGGYGSTGVSIDLDGNIQTDGNLTIAGTIEGASPVKIAGGLNVLTGVITGDASGLTNVPAGSHDHDADYVDIDGDTMTGTLTLGASTAMRVGDNQKLVFGNYGSGEVFFDPSGSRLTLLADSVSFADVADNIGFQMSNLNYNIGLWTYNSIDDNWNSLAIKPTKTVFNSYGGNFDTQIKGSGEANLVYVNAGTNRVGIGTDAPDTKLHVVGNVTVEGTIYGDGSGLTNIGGGSHEHDADYVDIDGDTMTGTLTMGASADIRLADNRGIYLGNDNDARVSFDGSSELQIDTIRQLYLGNMSVSGNSTYIGLNVNSSREIEFNADDVAIPGDNTIRISPAKVNFNENRDDVDFQVQGDTDASLIYADASADNVGIGIAAPDAKLHVQGGLKVTGVITGDASGLTNVPVSSHDHDADYVDIDGDTMTGTLTMGASADIRLGNDRKIYFGDPSSAEVYWDSGNELLGFLAPAVYMQDQLPGTKAGFGFDGPTVGTGAGAFIWAYDATSNDIEVRPTYTALNSSGEDVDTQIKGSGEAYLVYVDAGENRVGIGTNAPDVKLHVEGGLKVTGVITGDAAGLTNVPAGSHDHDADYINVGAGEIVNADVNASAAIDPSKISGTAWTGTNDGTGSGLDADLLDGNEAAAFSLTAHEHDADYVDVAGDTMTGHLTMSASSNVYLGDDQKLILGTAGAGFIEYDTDLGVANLQIAGGDYTFIGNIVNYESAGGSIVVVDTSLPGIVLETKEGGKKSSISITDGLIQLNEKGGTGAEQADVDVQVKGSTEENLVYVNAGTNRVGIGIAAPQAKLHVQGGLKVTGVITGDASGLSNVPAGSHDHDADYVDIDGDTMTGTLTMGASADIRLGDNRRLIFGAGEDAIMYSTGSSLNMEWGVTTNTANFQSDNLDIDAGSSWASIDDSNGVSIGTVNNELLMQPSNIFINFNGEDIDTQIKGLVDDNLIYADASADSVGIGIAAPQAKLHVQGGLKVTGVITGDAAGLTNVPVSSHDHDADYVDIDGDTMTGTLTLEADLYIEDTGQTSLLVLDADDNGPFALRLKNKTAAGNDWGWFIDSSGELTFTEIGAGQRFELAQGGDATFAGSIQSGGTVTATSFSGDGSALTGLVAEAGDTMTGPLTLEANLAVDTNILYVDAGNDVVGIATDAPGGNLHIEDTTQASLLILDADDSNPHAIRFENKTSQGVGDNDWAMFISDTGELMFREIGVETRLKIAQGGNATVTGGLTVTGVITGDAAGLTNIDATAIGAGAVDDDEFGYLDGVGSAIQTQIDGKSASGHDHDADYVEVAGDTMTGHLVLGAGASIEVNNNKIYWDAAKTNYTYYDGTETVQVAPGRWYAIESESDWFKGVGIDSGGAVMWAGPNATDFGQVDTNFTTGNVRVFTVQKTTGNAPDISIYTASGSTEGDGGNIKISAGAGAGTGQHGAITIEAAGELYLEDEHLSSPITLSESGETALSGSFTKTSVVGALNELQSGKLEWASAPASASDTGTAGQIAYDTNYLYICVATDTWKRVTPEAW